MLVETWSTNTVMGLQGAPKPVALVVSDAAAAGKAAPPLEFDEMTEPPAATAARHAGRYFNNVPPVSSAPGLGRMSACMHQ